MQLLHLEPERTLAASTERSAASPYQLKSIPQALGESPGKNDALPSFTFKPGAGLEGVDTGKGGRGRTFVASTAGQLLHHQVQSRKAGVRTREVTNVVATSWPPRNKGTSSPECRCFTTDVLFIG